MINNNKRYDLNDYNRSQNGSKYSRRLAMWQKIFLSLLAVSLIFAFILIGGIIGRVADKNPPTSGLIIKTPSDSAESSAIPTVAILTPVPTEPPYVVEELLETNTLADNYWGELVPAEEAIQYEHNEVRGLYINAAYNLEQSIELCNNSELNALVIDLKEAEGIYFTTTNETAAEIGYVNPQYDLAAICQQCHDNGIMVIGRIVCFKDPQLVAAFPDRAICDSTGEPLYFPNEGSEAFASPYDSRNWEYYIELAEEAITYGVDEIQFDYVRFPTGSSTTGNSPYYGIEDEVPSKSDAINRFLQTARIRIQDTLGVPLSADIFGIVVTSQLDGSILGQDWSTVGFTQVDSLCPMIYPSHYALGTMMNGVVYDTPDTHPYEIMYNALSIGSTYHGREGYSTVRPYLQAFTAAYIGAGNYMEYDYYAINEQIRALQDTGLSEFILWNASANYPEGNFGGNNG